MPPGLAVLLAFFTFRDLKIEETMLEDTGMDCNVVEAPSTSMEVPYDHMTLAR